MTGRTARVGLTVALALGACPGGSAARAAPPEAGAWALAAPMGTPRAGHTATLLPDGRVLVAGGWSAFQDNGAAVTLESAEVYDPALDAWTPVGPMTARRAQHAAVALPDGRVLLAGGCAGIYPYLVGWALCIPELSAELFDPSTGTLAPAGRMAHSRREGGILLPDGRVLFAGTETPRDGASPLIGPECELYDPATGAWTETGPMNEARSAPSLAVLPSGLVLAVGGSRTAATPSAAAELYDPARGTWRPVAPLDYGVRDHVLLALPTGEVLLASGRLDDHQPTQVEPRPEGRLFDPVSERWRATSPMTYRRQRAVGVVLTSGRVLLAGGNFFEAEGWGGMGWYPAPGGDVYDPWLDRWTPTPAEPHYVMYRSAAVAMPGERALRLGGNLYDGVGWEWSNCISIDATQVYREGP